jgi:serine/threonine-protein kinase
LVPVPELEQARNDPVLGTVIARKYAVIGVLGSGGFGTVYRAVQEPVGRQVAVKVVHAHYAKDDDLRARFFREARVVAQLTDPSVVTLFDYGDEEGLGLYTVFELVEGETLARRIKLGPSDPHWVAAALIQLLRALGEAHALGMVHRDIKPANIMVVRRSDGNEQVRLLDFGIAKVLPQGDREETVKTAQGVVVGTPEFMSPEQARAKEELDARSDIYSLGVVAYALLAGSNPFVRNSTIDTIMAHCSAEPPQFDAELGVPPGLQDTVLRALAKKPEDRFQSASEMARALSEAFPSIHFPSGLTPRPGSSVGGWSPDADPSGSRSQVRSGARSAVRSGARSSVSAPAEAALDEAPGTIVAAADELSRQVEAPKRTAVVAAVLLLLCLIGGAAVWALQPDGRVTEVTSTKLKSRPGRGETTPESSQPAEPAPSAESSDLDPAPVEASDRDSASVAGSDLEGAPAEDAAKAAGSEEAAPSDGKDVQKASRVAEPAAPPAPAAEPAKPKPTRKASPPRRKRTVRRSAPEPQPVEVQPNPPVKAAPPPEKKSIQVPEF